VHLFRSDLRFNHSSLSSAFRFALYFPHSRFLPTNTRLWWHAPSDVPNSDDESVHPRHDQITPFPVVLPSDCLRAADSHHRLVQRLEEGYRQYDAGTAVRGRDRLQTFVIRLFRHRSPGPGRSTDRFSTPNEPSAEPNGIRTHANWASTTTRTLTTGSIRPPLTDAQRDVLLARYVLLQPPAASHRPPPQRGPFPLYHSPSPSRSAGAGRERAA